MIATALARLVIVAPLLALAAGCASPGPASGGDTRGGEARGGEARPATAGTPRIDELARFPAGTFLENGDQVPDGTLYFTSYFDRRLLALAPGGGVREIATLPAHPVAVLAMRDGFLLTAHGQPFTAGPSFTQTQQLLVVAADGTLRESIPVPNARFLNGMTPLAGDSVLIADSIAATLWRFDFFARRVSPWLQHDALAQDPAAQEFRPGANGLKLSRDGVLVSNSSRGTLSLVRVQAGQPASAPQLVARTGPIDDFFLARDGSVYASTHGATLLRVAPDGTVSTVLEQGCDSCTAVFVDRTPNVGNALLVLTTGNATSAARQPARVLRVRLPGP